jgi:membrane protease YdiL (CAAX protease family)
MFLARWACDSWKPSNTSGKRWGTLTRLTDTSKAMVFTVLVLFFALAAGLTINVLHVASEFLGSFLHMFTPTVAVLVMLLLVTREGYSKEGWKALGVHRLGLSMWPIAFGVTLLVSVTAQIIVLATPLASFRKPEHGIVGELISFLLQVILYSLTFVLAEEIGWRGYLLPHLLSVGRSRSLVLVGLIQAAWHMPLIFLTPLYHAEGNRWLVLTLFVGTIVALSFFVGYLRIRTGSLWPAVLAHSVHNAAWFTLAAFTATSSPVVVNEYLAGDSGILILVGTALAAFWVGRTQISGRPEEGRSGVSGAEISSAEE